MVVDDNKPPPTWVEGVGWVPFGYEINSNTPRYSSLMEPPHLFNSRNRIEELFPPDVPADISLTTSEPDFESPEIEYIPAAELTYQPEPEISSGLSKTQQQIMLVMEEIEEKLIEKNRKYGDSALNPSRVFSKADPDEQIRVRLDDKISRLRAGQVDDDEDVLLDLIGYLVLLMIYKRNNGNT